MNRSTECPIYLFFCGCGPLLCSYYRSGSRLPHGPSDGNHGNSPTVRQCVPHKEPHQHEALLKFLSGRLPLPRTSDAMVDRWMNQFGGCCLDSIDRDRQPACCSRAATAGPCVRSSNAQRICCRLKDDDRLMNAQSVALAMATPAPRAFCLVGYRLYAHFIRST